MCYNFATFVLYLDVITLIYRENRLTSSEPALSAEYETILCYAGFFSFVFQLCTYLNFSQNFSVFSQKFFS